MRLNLLCIFFFFRIGISSLTALFGDFSAFLDEFLDLTLISEIILLVFYVPSQSLFFRRLHDTGVSGWWMLVQVTVVGSIPLYLWLIKSSKTENNKYINQVRINIWHKLYLSLYIISTLIISPIQTSEFDSVFII